MVSLHSTVRRAGLALAAAILPVLILSAPARLGAQTNAPAAAPAETDKETGKPLVTTPSGLKYVDLAPGTGPAVKAGDHIQFHYVGKLIDGKQFDSSRDRGQPLDYVVGTNQLIPGMVEGLSTMHVGGKRKLIIPPFLGYGMEGAGDVIPPNATLVFEVEIVAIKTN